jgi:hypothetical protein
MLKLLGKEPFTLIKSSSKRSDLCSLKTFMFICEGRQRRPHDAERSLH